MFEPIEDQFTIVDYKVELGSFTINKRQSKLGPENDLVQVFLNKFRLSNLGNPFHTTLFCEPRIESGYPDLVLVVWDPRIAKLWEPARRQLTLDDMRVLHFLFQFRRANLSGIESAFSFKVNGSLERLKAAGMIENKEPYWSVLPLSGLYAVKEIIAIEAKINNWTKALHQARTNTWFASLSYIFVPNEMFVSKIIERATEYGVGIWVGREGEKEVLPASRRMLPISYRSWAFNEAVWRIAVSNLA